MNPLALHLDNYLKLRRQLGYKLRNSGYLLHRFVRFAQQKRANFITTKLALGWATYATLTGLLAVTGMRVGEAISLDREDVDLIRGLLIVRRAKGGKTRLVPLHRTSRQVLRRYAVLRDEVFPPLQFQVLHHGTRHPPALLHGESMVPLHRAPNWLMPCRRPAETTTARAAALFCHSNHAALVSIQSGRGGTPARIEHLPRSHTGP